MARPSTTPTCHRLRRRHGEDGPAARHQLAFQQVPEPVTDGVVLPITPSQRLQDRQSPSWRISHEENHLFRGYGYTPHFVEGDDPHKMHELMAATLDTVQG